MDQNYQVNQDRMGGFWTQPLARKAGVAVLILLAIFLAVITGRELMQYRYVGAGVMPANTIAVTGQGEVFAIPDIAEFSFSVTELGATTAVAQEKAAVKINKALAYLEDEGIEEKDIKTIGYSAYPKYEYSQGVCGPTYCPPGKQVLQGYEVTQTISVKVRNTNKAGDLLTGVGGAGVQQVSGINFTVDDIEAVKAEAREKAIADAKAKAEVLRKDLGVRLVRIVSFNEYGSEPPMPYYYGKGGVAMDAVESRVAPDVPAGENKIVSTVNIVYEIR